MRYFIHLAYKGTNFKGWQKQPNAISVQECLEHILTKILGSETPITGCGRTDSGVHASDFYAHFDTETPINTDLLTHTLNKMTPSGIAVFSVFAVSQDMHARFSAERRTYTYTICRQKNPFKHDTALLYTYPLNINSMNEAAAVLCTYTDFTSFSKLHTDVNNNNCTVYKAVWTEHKQELIFTIEANRFLRNMVRAITGSLLDVGRGKISIAEFKDIIESKNRQNAGQSIAAHGLCLVQVTYPSLTNYI